MLRHMFKFMWNRKKRNFLLMIEIFFSFIVLLVIASMAISGSIKYLKPTGYSYENVWVLRCGWSATAERLSEEEMQPFREQIEQEFRSYNEIEQFSWTSYNFPYSNATIRTTFEWQGQIVDVDYLEVDDQYASVLDIPVVEGRWFDKSDDAMDKQPIVINRRLKEKYFGNESAVNKILSTEDSSEYFITGMIEDYRYKGEFESSERDICFVRKPSADIILFTVKPGTSVSFEEKLTKRLSSLIKDWNPRIENMQEMRSTYIKDVMTGIITMSVIAGFLIFNVALGLFGVLWNSISRRRNEIGLRRAVGADAGNISKQILGESLVLATFAIIIGIFLALQAPLFGLTSSVGSTSFIFAIACSALMIYLIVSICAVYPSWLAARIQPAEALHYE
jgi:putative ABC transport system permease protein